eukprot:CAMPEP_0168525882 /NCGR_PEP_ID=MMETSP0405-20121227/11593_1 /TAXON_ID=498012 /ORGANISM="Trichosphaerium sp, Strain Am-I-7 wt" /LENGTH=624 /DNA_ID=CAMNT_0008548531 /DNA_START=1 /DNA_END=1875 /DNA_ORIENTATION=+
MSQKRVIQVKVDRSISNPPPRNVQIPHATRHASHQNLLVGKQRTSGFVKGAMEPKRNLKKSVKDIDFLAPEPKGRTRKRTEGSPTPKRRTESAPPAENKAAHAKRNMKRQNSRIKKRRSREGDSSRTWTEGVTNSKAAVLRVTPGLYTQKELETIDRRIFNFEDRSPENVTFNLNHMGSNGLLPQIKAGTIESLIASLTPDNYSDGQFVNTFLMTFRMFSTPEEIFELLSLRWNLPVPRRNSEAFKQQKILPIRLRVLNCVKIWIEEHFYDLVFEEDTMNQMAAFIDSTIALEYPGQAKKLHSYLQARKQGQSRKYTIQYNGTPPAPYIPCNLTSEMTVLDIHPLEMARQIALMDHNLLKKMKPNEFLNGNWTKADKKKLAPNILKMIARFNRISEWTATEILARQDVKARAHVLNYVICVADKCKDLCNFNALMAIVAALHNSAIFRLHDTWQYLPERSMNMFNALALLMNGNAGEGNFCYYRKAIQEVTCPRVPYLGLSLTDLTMITDGMPIIIPETKQIHFHKLHRIASTIRQIQQYQQSPYCFEPVMFIQDWLMSRAVMDEEQQYKASTLLEKQIPKAQRIALANSKNKKKIKPIQVPWVQLGFPAKLKTEKSGSVSVHK